MPEPASGREGVCLPGGVCSGVVSALGECLLWGGVCSRGEGCLLQGAGVSTPGGVYSQGVSAPRGGVSALGGGCLLLGLSAPVGVSAPRGEGCLLQGGVCSGGCLLPGGVVSQHALRQTPPPPWTESQTPVKTLPWPQLRCGR